AEDHIMAAILSPVTQKIYLFKDYRVWCFSSLNSLEAGYPKQLSGYNTPYNPIAALYHENRIWLLKGDLLFPFDEKTVQFVTSISPKRVNQLFPGVPGQVRTAFTYNNRHYFFTESDRKVYVWNQQTNRLEAGYPKPMEHGWFACSNKNDYNQRRSALLSRNNH
ncbi:unnamed protein product, partial [Didymodactylos carnosus]